MRWLLLALALTLGIAHSQEPPKSKVNQQKSAAEQRGTEHAPLFVKTPSPSTQEEREYEAYEKHEKPANERKITDATVALAWITGILAAFTALLWGATYCLVRNAKDTAKRQLRAYVNVAIVKMVNAKRDGFIRQQVHIELKNFGQTPAQNIRLWREMDIRELPLVGNLERTTTRTVQHGVLAPSDVYKSIQDTPLFDSADGAEVHERKKALYVWGELRYDDAFGDERITYFQYVYTGADWLSDGEMYVCETGNDAT